ILAATFAPRPLPVDAFERTTSLAAGRFTLLNREYDLGRPIDFNKAKSAPLLSQFHLHYHEFLLDVAASSETVWDFVLHWMAAHERPDRSAAWHPYCMSRRIPVWCAILLERKPSAPVAAAMRSHLSLQAARLERRLERDLGGNHLWENARALATAGACFAGPDADRWRDRGVRLLAECIRTQILPSGEHYERSPMYQADLALGLEDLARWLRPSRPAVATEFASVATRMHAFLDAIRHPDGGIPLFGDATRDHDSTARSPARPGSAWVGDYYVHREVDGRTLLFDAGDVGPDDLPAHAHSDLLGCELSVFGKRLLVDSGVFEYAGPKRHAYRRASAHNVLTLGGEELADVWSSFRMGRRGHVIKRSAGATEGGRWASAEHDAYRRRGAAIRRLWFLADDGPWFSVHLLNGRSDAAGDAAEHLHWHPDVRWDTPSCSGSRETSGGALLKSHDSSYIRKTIVAGRPVWWETASTCELETAPSEYSERFSQATPNESWTLSSSESRENFDSPRLLTAWALSFNDRPAQPRTELHLDRIEFSWEDAAGARRSAVVPIR
ncbi:MAG TPA: alginate lyase family protein, partial [Planctomycetia bacterium]|nr:alginate lyase family protein [Planctomycetia bacterium]